MFIDPASLINEHNKAHLRQFANAAGDNLPYYDGLTYSNDLYTDHYYKCMFYVVCIPDWWDEETKEQLYDFYNL